LKPGQETARELVDEARELLAKAREQRKASDF